MTEIFIIEKSFLIRSAFTKLILDIDRQNRVHEMKSLTGLSNFHGNRDNAVIIVNEELLPENHEKEFLKLRLRNFRLLTISNNKEANYNAGEVIFLDEDAESILHKLNKLLVSQKSRQNKVSGTKILSGRETNILRYVALGLTNKEIADKLFISTHTVIAHRKNISSKLGIKTIAGFAVYALLNNIILPNDIPTN